MRIYQNTPENVRKSLARVTLAYHKGQMDETRAKTLAHLFNVQLGYWKFLKEIELEKRLDEIEKQLAGDR